MGDIPHPPKLKLTPRNRAFLAGELYPPDEPYDQPHVEERNKRNLKGVADARATLNATKPYEEGTQGQWFYDVKPSPVGYFKAGTHGQGFEGLGLHTGDTGEDVFTGPEPSYKTSELMNRHHLTEAVQARRPSARASVVSDWIVGNPQRGTPPSIPGTIAGWKDRTGGLKRKFPKAVSPEEWGSGRHGLWVRSDVERWMDDAGLGTGKGGTGDSHHPQPKAEALLESVGHVSMKKKSEDHLPRGPKPSNTEEAKMKREERRVAGRKKTVKRLGDS